MSLQPNTKLELLCRTVTEAGTKILPFFQKSFTHQVKADNSPLTEADLASHRFLVKSLTDLEPRLTVISEESETNETLADLPQDYWLIDPLDGTKEFMKGKPEFTVNLALMRKRRPVLGIVHAPALRLTYFAQVGEGAWRQEGANAPVPIRTRPSNLKHLTVVASKDHSGPCVKRLLATLGSPEVVSVGSSLKFCLIAEGKADLYFRDGPTMEWDTAAAQCVMETAGGRVLDLQGEVLGYGKPGLKNPAFVAVGDPNFHWSQLDTVPHDQSAFRSFFARIDADKAT